MGSSIELLPAVHALLMGCWWGSGEVQEPDMGLSINQSDNLVLGDQQEVQQITSSSVLKKIKTAKTVAVSVKGFAPGLFLALVSEKLCDQISLAGPGYIPACFQRIKHVAWCHMLNRTQHSTVYYTAVQNIFVQTKHRDALLLDIWSCSLMCLYVSPQFV